MPAVQTRDAITNVLNSLDAASLLYFHQNPLITNQRGEQFVTWPNHHPGASYYVDAAFGTLTQYCQALQDRAFLAILADGAILKASYRFCHNDLVKHSLWYWPCPLCISPDAFKDNNPLDAIELYSVNWRDYVRFRSPVRFDFDPQAARANHPASHLHMQNSDCRIPVERPLAFSSFVCFIFRNFYHTVWDQHDFWSDLSSELDEEDDSCLIENDLWMQHIGWKKPL